MTKTFACREQPAPLSLNLSITSNGDEADKLERAIVIEAKRDEDMRRLVTMPDVGVIVAASIYALVPDPHGFMCGRYFAAWLGLASGKDLHC